MATIDLQGTRFSFSVLPLKPFSNGYYARTEIKIQNEYTDYQEIGETLSRDDLEEWIFSIFRLLAGAYGREYDITFEKAGIAVDLYPYTKDGEEVSREERRQNDCVMALRLLMLSSDKKSRLGGVYSLLFHRKEMEKFAVELREEFYAAFGKLVHGRGKYLFVGVSPLGYKGCNYWYLAPTKKVKAGEYVWVKMGRHNTEQIVYVDAVRRFDDDTAPYDPTSIKRVLRKATEEEINTYRNT